MTNTHTHKRFRSEWQSYTVDFSSSLGASTGTHHWHNRWPGADQDQECENQTQMCHKWALDFTLLTVQNLRPALFSCSEVENDNSSLIAIGGDSWKKKKNSVLQFHSGCKMHSCSCGKSSFHILVYAAAGCIMNRRSRSKITDAPPPSPLKKVPSASTWFTLKCTRVALGRAFSGTDGPVTCPLISQRPPWTERNVNSRQTAYVGAGSCKSQIPRLSKRCFRFTYVQFSLSAVVFDRLQ